MPIKLKGHEEVIKGLTNLQKGQVPFAASWALNQTGFQLKQDEGKYMEDVFRDPTPFTMKSVLYTKSTKKDLKIKLFHRDEASKGNAPALYLAPQVTGGEVFVTRFTRRLQAKYPQHVPPGSYVPHWLPGPGAPGGRGAIQKVLAGLGDIPNVFASAPKAFARGARQRQRQQGKYFFRGTGPKNPTKATRKRSSSSGYKGPGIYTQDGRDVALVYSILSKPISVAPRYEWNEDRIEPAAQAIFAEKFQGKLDELFK